ncbi:hypothetical protein MJO28_007948 [Puccinia striiformis f. sp. tritici]|uniref:Uncharacterized protein n=2 Tax=Puccinia striiformis TaxID=27350 RepID=A0A2S4WME1_9BASI|nr:hypothetical protein MJO28_007948 [Puccinia striiformis f. sp. tritici]POW22923.1 hypothetical protein PSHT_00706 [Puccinia striiformis]
MNPTNQTRGGYKKRIRQLEEVVSFLLTRSDPAGRACVSTAPPAGLFWYSINRGLIPLLSKTTEESLNSHWRNAKFEETRSSFSSNHPTCQNSQFPPSDHSTGPKPRLNSLLSEATTPTSVIHNYLGSSATRLDRLSIATPHSLTRGSRPPSPVSDTSDSSSSPSNRPSSRRQEKNPHASTISSHRSCSLPVFESLLSTANAPSRTLLRPGTDHHPQSPSASSDLDFPVQSHFSSRLPSPHRLALQEAKTDQAKTVPNGIIADPKTSYPSIDLVKPNAVMTTTSASSGSHDHQLTAFSATGNTIGPTSLSSLNLINNNDGQDNLLSTTNLAQPFNDALVPLPITYPAPTSITSTYQPAGPVVVKAHELLSISSLEFSPVTTTATITHTLPTLNQKPPLPDPENTSTLLTPSESSPPTEQKNTPDSYLPADANNTDVYPSIQDFPEYFDEAELVSITVLHESDDFVDPQLALDFSQASLQHYDDISNHRKTLGLDENKINKKKKKKKKKKTPDPIPTPDNPVLFYV